MNDFIDALEERTPKKGNGTRLQAGKDGFSYSAGKSKVAKTPTKQLKISTLPDNRSRVYYGQVYGMGFSGLISNLTDLDWTEFESGANTAFYLKVTFDPIPRAITIYAGNGDEQTVYTVGSGGRNTTTEILAAESDETPTDKAPLVNVQDGSVTQKGIYHYRVGTIDSSNAARNDFYGPLSISFCGPDSMGISILST